MASSTPTKPRILFFPETLALTESTTGTARALLEAPTSALPFGWLLLFGSRNIWEPGESVKDRGGAAADRDPLVTMIDMAQARLNEANSAVGANPNFAPLLSPLQLLARILDAQGRHGQLRLLCPPETMGGHQNLADVRRFFLEHVAMAENVVNYLGHANESLLNHTLGSLRKVCAFVPSGQVPEDVALLRKKAQQLGHSSSIEQTAVRLLIGWPLDRSLSENFESVTSEIVGDLEKEAEKARSRPKPAKAAVATKESASGASATRSRKPWWAFWKK